MLLETGAPHYLRTDWQYPHPEMVRYVGAEIASKKEMSKKVADQKQNNTRSIYGIS